MREYVGSCRWLERLWRTFPVDSWVWSFEAAVVSYCTKGTASNTENGRETVGCN